MFRSSHRILGAVVLLLPYLAGPGLALAQSTVTDAEKAQIIRAVLEAEQQREERAFESVTQLSTENIASLTPARFAADFKLTLITPNEIEERAKDFVGVHYLAFKDFKIGGGRAVVKLAVAKEMTPCFGPHQKYRKEVTYRLEKTGGAWKAKLVGHALANPLFGAKPGNAVHPAANRPASHP